MLEGGSTSLSGHLNPSGKQALQHISSNIAEAGTAAVVPLILIWWYWGAAMVTAAKAEKIANILVFILRDGIVEI
jgi:hypothetical protein